MNAPSALPVAVLREDADLGAGERLHGRRERDVRRADDDVDVVRQVGVAQRAAERAGLARALEHLPVAGDQRHAGDRLHAGELLALEQLERRAAAGRDPRDAVGDAGLVHGAHRVAAADDREAVAVGDRLARPRTCPSANARPLEHAHRPVPEHGLRAGDRAARTPRASPARCRGRASRRAARRTASPASPRRRRTTSAATTSTGQDRLERERVLGAHVLGHLAADQHRVGPRAEVLRARRSCPRPSRRPRRSRTAARPRRAARPRLLQLVEQQQPGVRGQQLARRRRSRRARGAPSRTRR